MYTLDFIKSLHIDLETWNNGPGTLVEEDHYNLADYYDDDQLKPLMDHDDEIQDFLDGVALNFELFPQSDYINNICGTKKSLVFCVRGSGWYL